MSAYEQTLSFFLRSGVRQKTEKEGRLRSNSEDQRTNALPFEVHQTVSPLVKTEADQAHIRQSVKQK